MDIVYISNILNKLTEADEKLLFYHFGYLDELDINPVNNFNQDSKKGRLYPCLDWIVPDNISFKLDEQEKEVYKIDLYFQDLQGYDNKSNTDTRTRLEVWRDLMKIAKRFILTLERFLCENGAGGINTNTITLEPGAFVGRRKTQDIKVSFDLLLSADCIDVDAAPLPSVTETDDLENYCREFTTQSLEYNGINKRAILTDTSALNFEWNESFSFELWFYTSGGTVSGLLSKWNDQSGFVLRSFSTGAINFIMRTGAFLNGRTLSVASAAGEVLQNEWNHLIISNNGAGNSTAITAFLNGQSSALSNPSGNIITTGTIKQIIKPLEIGSSTFFGWFHEGFINVFRAYNSVFTPAEALEAYGDGCPKQAVKTPIYDINPAGAVWNGSAFELTDESGNQPLTVTVFMDENDLNPVNPCI